MESGYDQEMEPLTSSRPFFSKRPGSSSSAEESEHISPHTLGITSPIDKDESSFWSGTKLVWSYIFAEVRRQPLSFILAVFTVFITVLVIALLTSAVSTSSLIFFRMAEINAGEQDLVLLPGMGLVEERVDFNTGNPFLNQTLSDIALFGGGTPYDSYTPNTPPSTESAGLSSRFLMFGLTKSPLQIHPDGTETPISDLTSSGILIGIDSIRERIMGLGRDWTATKSPVPDNGIYMSRTLVRQMGVTDGIISAIQDQASHRFDRFEQSNYDIKSANDYYKRRNPETRAWEGSAQSVMPLLTLLLRIDATQLVSQLVGDTIPMSPGNGTADDPYVIEYLQQATTLSLMEMTGTPPPEGCASWSRCWGQEFRHSQLAQQIDFAEMIPVQQGIDRFVEEALALPETHPLHVFVLLANDIVFDIPITQLTPIWDAIFNQNLPLTVNLDEIYYSYPHITPSPIPHASDLDPSIEIPVVNLRIIRDQPNPNPHFTFDADLFNKSFREAIKFDAKPAPPAPQNNDYPKGGTFGDYYTTMISLAIGLVKTQRELVVADVFGSPQGKLAETLGAVILMELEPLVSNLKDPMISLVDSEAVVNIPQFEIDIGTIIDESNIIIDGVPIVIGPYIITFDETEFRLSYRQYLINVEQLTEEEADERILQTKLFIESVVGRDMSPMVVIQMGPGGAADIKQAYIDQKIITDSSNLQNTANRDDVLATNQESVESTMSLTTALSHLYNNINYQHHPDAVLNLDKWLENQHSVTSSNESAIDSSITDDDGDDTTPSTAMDRNETGEEQSSDETFLETLVTQLKQRVTFGRSQPQPQAVEQDTEYNTAPTPSLPTSVIKQRQQHRRKQYLCNESCLVQNIAYFANDAFLSLGNNYPASVTPPLFEALKTSQFMVAFLDSLFGAIVGLICALSAILIYSLFLLDVEQKNYEYGILRALGMKQSQLVQLLIVKSFLVGIIGILFGLLAAYLLFFPIANLIADEASIDNIGSLTTPAIAIAICVGIIVPLISNIVPISRALSQVLRNALQLYHSSLSEITVTIKRLEEVGLDMWQTAIALMLICFGFVTFYLIPMSFLNQNIPMFLALLMIILSCMILGLAILAQIFQPFLELAFLWLITIKSPALQGIIKKALGAHRSNNTKVALMLTITVAFVVFAGVVFALQSHSLAASVRLLLGAPIIVTSPSIRMPLPETELHDYLAGLESITDQNHPMYGVVSAHGFLTFTLYQVSDFNRIRVSPISLHPSQYQQIYGVQPTFSKSSYFSLYSEMEANSGPSGSSGLDAMFTDAGGAKLPIEPSLPEEYERFIESLPSLTSGGLPLTGAMYTLHNKETYDDLRKDILSSLYQKYTDVVINEAVRTPLAIDTKVPIGISFQGSAGARVRQVDSPYDYMEIPPDESFFNPGSHFVYMAKARAMADRMPGFFFSKYSSLARAGAAIVPEDQMWRLLDMTAKARGLPSPGVLPKQRLMVNVPPHINASLREDVVAGIRSLLPSDQIIVTDTEKVIDAMQGSINLLNILFIIVSVIAMVLCFIMMSIAVTANVHHNAWENGVLRSIGLTSIQVMLVYVIESLCIALSCLLTGTIIGILIAISLTLLFSLFTGLGFVMQFPYALYFSLVAMIIIVAIFSAFIPAYRFSRQKISHILRRT